MVQGDSGDTMQFEVESRLDDLFGEADDISEESEETPPHAPLLRGDEAIEFEEPEALAEPEFSAEPEASVEPVFFEESEDPEEPEFLDIQVEGIEMDEKHPLDELKSTVLSIDWEITDEVMSRFVDQVEDLKREFRDNKINLLFLQLLGSVGLYIKTNRGKADPEAFKVLGSSFKAFDDVVSSNNMPNAEKKSKLTVELEKFKELKKKIAAKKQAKKSPPGKESALTAKQPTSKSDKPAVKKPERPVVENEPIQLVVEATPEASGGNDDVQEIVLNPVEEKSSGQSQEIINEVLMEMKKFIRGEFDDLREELRLRKKRR